MNGAAWLDDTQSTVKTAKAGEGRFPDVEYPSSQAGAGPVAVPFEGNPMMNPPETSESSP